LREATAAAFLSSFLTQFSAFERDEMLKQATMMEWNTKKRKQRILINFASSLSSPPHFSVLSQSASQPASVSAVD